MHRSVTHRLPGAVDVASPSGLGAPPQRRLDRDGRGIRGMPRRNLALIIARRRASGARRSEAPASMTRSGADPAHGGELVTCGLSRRGLGQCGSTSDDKSRCEMMRRLNRMSNPSVNSVSNLKRWKGPSRGVPRGSSGVSNVCSVARRLPDVIAITPLRRSRSTDQVHGHWRSTRGERFSKER